MRFLAVFLLVLFFTTAAIAKPPKNSSSRSKFYDFSEQIIDGEIRRPTALYTNARQKVRFGRLLRLKKSFMPKLFDTARERVFK
jgi:hypothetical protein